MTATGRAALVGAGAGLVAALMLLSPRAGGSGAVILVQLAALPLFAAGLGWGLRAALVGAAVQSLVLALAAGFVAASAFAAMFAVPAVLLSRQALLWRRDAAGAVEWYPPGLLAAWLTGLAAVGLTLGALAASGSGVLGGGMGIEQRIARFLSTELAQAAGPDLAAEFDAQVSLLARFPAVAVLGWLLLMVANGALAQGLVTALKVARRPSPRMAELALPDWFPWLAAAFAAASLADGLIGFLGRNLLVIQGFAYFLAGLAVLHAWSMRFASRLLVLVTAYAVTLLLPGMPLVVAVVGFFEHWARLRLRLAGGPGAGGK